MMDYHVYQKTRVLSALFWYFLSHTKHFTIVWKPVRIYSHSSRRLSVPLVKWSMLKWASFPSGSFREKYDFMNEGNKLPFYSLDKVCQGKFQLYCQNKVEGVYASVPCVTQLLWTDRDVHSWDFSDRVFHWESDSFFSSKIHGNISAQIANLCSLNWIVLLKYSP